MNHMNNSVDWFDENGLDEMPMADVMEEFQRYEDGIAFGSCFLVRRDMKMVAVHPAECIEGAEGWWRIEFFMKPEDPDCIYARIADEDEIKCEIVGACVLDKKPCCNNLSNARRIVNTIGPSAVQMSDHALEMIRQDAAARSRKLRAAAKRNEARRKA
jgi:hypothetical protein